MAWAGVGLMTDSREDRKKKFMQTGLDNVVELCRERHKAKDGQSDIGPLNTDSRDGLFIETDFDLKSFN
jgi:hypothetical protein